MECEDSFNGTQFPADIMTEILSRLAVKPLLRFRSVSKSWLSLISSTEFIKTHLSISSNKEDSHHVFILDEVGEQKWGHKECSVTSLFVDSVTQALDLDVHASPGLYLKGSCNGLIFLDHDSLESSLIWNPTIRKHKTLAIIRPRWKEYLSVYGFGYDELHDDCKLVVIFYHYIICCSDDIEVKVYSLKSDSWTSVDYCDDTFFVKKSVGYSEEILCYRGFFVHGKLHWGTSISDPDPNVCENKNIIAFDLANEKWEKVEKPSYGVGETESCVGKLGTDLSVFCDYERTHIGAWVMKEYGVKESWIKMFTIRYPNDPNWDPPFFIANKGEILSVFGSTFMIYNSKDDSFRYSDVTNCHHCEFADFYIESLVCPFSTEGTENGAKRKEGKALIKIIE